jgi:hypothetical protein
MVLLDVLGALFGGGITGLIGNISTAIINYKTQKIKNEHEENLERIKVDAFKSKAEVIKGFISGTSKEIKEAADGATSLADAKAFEKSMDQGTENVFSSAWIDKLLAVKGFTSWISFPIAFLIIILFGLVDFLKSLMRPGITIYMMVASTWVTWLSYSILDSAGIEKIKIEDALNIFNTVIMVIIYLTISCVTWWFGDRQTSKFLMKLKDGNIKPPSISAIRQDMEEKVKEIGEEGDYMPHKS